LPRYNFTNARAATAIYRPGRTIREGSCRTSGLTINNRAFKPQLLNVRVLLSCIFQLALYFRTSTFEFFFFLLH